MCGPINQVKEFGGKLSSGKPRKDFRQDSDL